MLGLIKATFLACIMMVLLSFLFALPLWALWPWGPRVLGAPSVDYLTMACALLTLAVSWMAIYLGGNCIKAAAKVIIASAEY